MRALYREHAGPLLAYVLRLVAGDRQRAEDVVQETLIRAWKTPRPTGPPAQSDPGW
ncbi:ECF RNA polymerase sigma factor SigL [Streptomyces badius]